jgi:hypothetical protein
MPAFAGRAGRTSGRRPRNQSPTGSAEEAYIKGVRGNHIDRIDLSVPCIAAESDEMLVVKPRETIVHFVRILRRVARVGDGAARG